MKKWLKITIVGEPVLVDSIADFLVGVIAAGVEIGVDDHIAQTTLNAFVEKESPAQEEIDSIVAQIHSYIEELAGIFHVDSPDLSWEIVEDEDWGKSWKKHFTPFNIVPGLVIAPTWENYQADIDEQVIIMDPGMAFGTGHHATTALSLQMIMEELQNARSGTSTLDVGTGTGILGMAASLYGAERVLGIDNDMDAVMAARENVERNNLTSVMEVSESSLADLSDTYSLVVANIIHDVLLLMAEDLKRLTTTGGKLILSGILQGQQAKNVVSAFQGVGFKLEKELQREEWTALCFNKAGE